MDLSVYMLSLICYKIMVRYMPISKVKSHARESPKSNRSIRYRHFHHYRHLENPAEATVSINHSSSVIAHIDGKTSSHHCTI